MRPYPTRERLNELLSYEPETGALRWRVRRKKHGSPSEPGDIAGVTNSHGYHKVTIDQKQMGSHRAIWIIMTGSLPPEGYEIDHINGDRADNRWANLRLVSRSQNCMNSGLSRRSTTGVCGVYQRKDTGKWHARITVQRKVILLGQFDTKERAVAAREAAEVKYFGNYRRVA